MGSASCSVTTTAANELYATVTWDSGPEVTVSVYTTAHEWRLKKRGYSGNTGIVYGPSTATSCEFTFDAEDGGEYIFQALDDLSYQYENLSFAVSGFTVDFGSDSSSSGSSSSTSSHYLYVQECRGAKFTVSRIFSVKLAESEYGELVDGELILNDGKYWRRYEVWDLDGFNIQCEALPGYTLKTYTVDGQEVNFNISGFLYFIDYDDDPDLPYGSWLINDGGSGSGGKIWLSVSATYNGAICIDDGAEHPTYHPYIYNGTDYVLYDAYIDTGTDWEQITG